MIRNILASGQVSKELVSIADRVAYSRPPALREFDQIYMMSGDMLTQVELVKEYIEGRRIVFLGDGDGMSMLFGLLARRGYLEPPEVMRVLDFDKRIVENIESFSDKNRFREEGIIVRTNPYNVIDPIPDSLLGQYDFFYINPPYGSKNNGKSIILWLQRCMDLCTYTCSGCIVIPYDAKEEWSQEAMINVQKFLASKGFVVRDMVSYLHSYHLRDNPVLQSATMIVDRIERHESDYRGEQLPEREVHRLYGDPRPIPKYIDIGEKGISGQGDPDYDWKFGRNN